MSVGVSVCDRIGSPRPRSRRGIWAPDRKSPNATLCRLVQSADSELGLHGPFRLLGEQIFASYRGEYDNRCTSTHAPLRNFGFGTEFRKTSTLSILSECRFRIVVT
ncbi:hypothetical protein Taro_055901 [Colocasia esculenta]|uniref:Uncharacterized protein n=1 Tax=Colocasia esculenta TaxID=4460 RepID=A0A843XUR5_COLES|nr:hypothetical protein [Colocasia esculenta]